MSSSVALLVGIVVGLVVGVLVAALLRPRRPDPERSAPADGATPEAVLSRRLLDLIDPAVVLLDPDDVVLLANPAARSLGIVRDTSDACVASDTMIGGSACDSSLLVSCVPSSASGLSSGGSRTMP